MTPPKLIQQVIEVRYDRGYRYLDRCGDAMLILEQALSASTGQAWMPGDLKPTGAIMKCPGLDIELRFDTLALNIGQTPANPDTNLPQIAVDVMAVLSSRFDLRTALRIACRRITIIGTDDMSDANLLSARLAPPPSFITELPDSFKTEASEVVVTRVSKDESKGYRLEVEPVLRAPEAESKDDRIRIQSRYLPKGQKEALIEQQKRKKRRESDPAAGVTIDLDYYHSKPERFDILSVAAEALVIEQLILANLPRGN